MKDYEILTEKAAQLLAKKKYEEVLVLLNGIPRYDDRIQMCYELLSLEAVVNAINEFGEVRVMENREEYERTRAGMGDFSPYAVLYRNPKTDYVDGLEEMIDLVPLDNPLKRFYLEIN